MIRSVLTLRPKAGDHNRVMAYYEQRGILQRAVHAAGCRSAEIQLRIPHHDAIVVTALWASRGDYARWVESSERADDVHELLTLLHGDPDVLDEAHIYEVVDAVDAHRGQIEQL